MEHQITMTETKLTDGPHVYDVTIGGARFPCIDFHRAARFVECFQASVKDCTNETAKLIELQTAEG